MLKYAGDERPVLLADTWNPGQDCRYIVNPPWLNPAHGRADYTISTPLWVKAVNFDSIFETLH